MIGRNTNWLAKKLRGVHSNGLLFASLFVLSEFISKANAASVTLDYFEVNSTHYLLNISSTDPLFQGIRTKLLEGMCSPLTRNNVTSAAYQRVWQYGDTNHIAGGTPFLGELLRITSEDGIKQFEQCSEDYVDNAINTKAAPVLIVYASACVLFYYLISCLSYAVNTYQAKKSDRTFEASENGSLDNIRNPTSVDESIALLPKKRVSPTC